MPFNFQTAFESIRALWLRAFLFVTEPVFRFLLPDPYTNAGNTRVEKKLVHQSKITMTEIVTAADVNILDVAFAGTILSWIDIAAGIAAKRHSSVPAVTRSVDGVAFLRPVKKGDILKIQATVNKSWKTSMEVGVKVEAESPLSNERVFVAHAYLTFVALSPRPTPHTYLGKQFIQYLPIAVPHIEPTTPMEKRRFDMAEERRQTRLLRRPNQPNRTAIRDTMHAYAQGLNLHQDQDAVIQSHPAFVPHALTDEARPSRHHQRRYSMDPKMLQPVQSMETEESFAEVVKLVMPQHANSLSITFGGQIISWMELCALTSANRLAKAYLLTASIDSLNFIRSTRIGDVVTIRSIVSRTYTSSMEVYVSVEAENLQTGEINFTNDGFFTITAVDKELVPVVIPRVIPQTQAEVEMYEEGNERRNKRLLHRQELLDVLDHPPSSPTQ